MAKLTFENVSSVPTPSVGQTSIFIDSADKHAKQIDDAGVIIDLTTDTGEANTASNVGTAGVGVFKQKTGIDLEFKKINAGSTKVTVTDDVGNGEIDIDVNESQINHDNIANNGTNSHTQIDNHISATNNPHNTDYAGVSGADGSTDVTGAELETLSDGSNADLLHTHALSSLGVESFKTMVVPNGTNPVADSPTDTLNFTSTDDSVEITGDASTDTIDLAINGTLTEGKASQARRQAVHSHSTSGFTAISFDNTDVQTDTDIIEHETITNPTRITVKKGGTNLYRITYYVDSLCTNTTESQDFDLDAHVYGTIGGAGPLMYPGSDGIESDHYSFSGNFSEDGSISKSFLVELDANDYFELRTQVTLRVGTGTTTVQTIKPSMITCELLETVVGTQGPAGSGSSISLEEGGTLITNTPHTNLDFDASDFSVTDNGDGSATVTLDAPSFGGEYQYAESEGLSTTTSPTFQDKVTLVTTALPLGDYIVFWSADIGNTNTDQEIEARFIEGATTYSHAYKTSKVDNVENFATFSGHKKLSSISGVKTFKIQYLRNGGTAQIKFSRISIWKVG